ncbi:carbohydrate kinase [Nocardiopsis sp. MG754419]|uniref:carbohydrate kinase family protein n=1 Tax=Nocardiopsis sp. MG754419 TaxID=2259865 RepID=UPI001BAC1259|nr:carbohydrate kinase [Nocardiopsis sp. MG754419]MBR8744498.1 carbohydrate kinase [Nocardiopsis sp. MG754419]
MNRHASARLVVVGENVMDLLPSRHGPQALWAAPGGGPANTAVAASRLGLPTRLLARIGSDGFGSMIRERLLGEGLDPDGLIDAEEPSALALATLGPDGSANYDFRMDDAADWRWRAGELPDTLDGDVTALHAASIALFREPGATLIESLLRREHGRGRVTITLDPNIRADVIGDPSAARGVALRHVAQAHVVKASDEDLAFLYPDLTLNEAAAALAALGPVLVVVTRGAEGAFALSHGVSASVRAPKAEVVDTVGAGDSFMGALLHRLDLDGRLGSAPRERLAGLTEVDLEELLTHAAAAAAHTVTREGADPPTEEELKAVLARTAPTG